ncbi:MAG: hypothetical protein WDO74_14475 [Pseudomonadota bacterium]
MRVSFARVRAVAALILLSVTIQSVPAYAVEPEASAHVSPSAAPVASTKTATTTTPALPHEPLTRDRSVAAGLAIVPGIALHGSGHYALGHKKTALALLITEGVGLVLLIGGISTLLVSGNSRHLAGPALVSTVFGSGLLVASFGTDLYGTLALDGDAVDLLPRAPPRVESELGYRYVADPHFRYGHFVVESLTLRQGDFRLTPSAWFATDTSNVRYRVEGAYRVLGLEPGELGKHDDHLDVVLGGLHQRYVPERFQRSGIELTLDTRFDFCHFGDTLRGSFIDLAIGYGLAKVTYDIPGLRVPADRDDLLLARVGLGVALRGRAAPGSEARVYYDHRHDDYAAGLLTPGRISGVFGKLGTDLRWFFTPRLGVLVDAQMGSAFVGGLSLLLRDGTLRTHGASP